MSLTLLLVASLFGGCDVDRSHDSRAGASRLRLDSTMAVSHGAQQPPAHQPRPSDTSLARRRTIFDSLLAVTTARGGRVRADPWSSETFPRRWTRVEMTDTALIIHDRSSGDTELIRLGDDSLVVEGIIEPLELRLLGVTTPGPDRATITADAPACDESGATATFDVILLDPATGLSRWRWQWRGCGWSADEHWLMVPTEHADAFPVVVRDCGDRRCFEEHEFLELPTE